jgi:hypothetical protein
MRAALEEAKANLPGNLKGFPDNCCCHVSKLLLVYFEDNGMDVNRFRWCIADLSGDDTERHVWLEIDGVVIDITADQFAGRYPVKFKPVVVSRSSAWHAALKTKRENPGRADEPVTELCKRVRTNYVDKQVLDTLRPLLELGRQIPIQHRGRKPVGPLRASQGRKPA